YNCLDSPCRAHALPAAPAFFYPGMQNRMTPAMANTLPRLHLLATGGTIAGASHCGTQVVGYQPAVTGVDVLLAAVPELASVAHIAGGQFAQVASHDIDTATLLTLARRTNALLASGACDGVLITHGTTTLDATAYFLNLVIKSHKPVVLVGAMRPS